MRTRFLLLSKPYQYCRQSSVLCTGRPSPLVDNSQFNTLPRNEKFSSARKLSFIIQRSCCLTLPKTNIGHVFAKRQSYDRSCQRTSVSPHRHFHPCRRKSAQIPLCTVLRQDRCGGLKKHNPSQGMEVRLHSVPISTSSLYSLVGEDVSLPNSPAYVVGTEIVPIASSFLHVFFRIDCRGQWGSGFSPCRATSGCSE